MVVSPTSPASATANPHLPTAVKPIPEDFGWLSPTPPRNHQRQFKYWRRGGGLDGQVHKNALLLAGLGLGKTLSAIEEILSLVSRRPEALVLVLARNSNLVTVWADQLDQHAPGIKYTVLNTSMKGRLDLLAKVNIFTQPHVFIHNHESLPQMGKHLSAIHWDMIVVDESARFRTASAARTRLLTGAMARPLKADFRLALSGMPQIKRYTDLYPILKWLGAWKGTKADFVDRFIIMGGFSGTEEIALKDKDGLNELMASVAFNIPKGSVMNLPRAWHYESVDLKPWQRETYARVQRELRTRFIDPATDLVEERVIQNRLGELLRLAQVTAGFEAVGPDRYEWRDDNAKAQHLLHAVLPDLEGEKVILWAHYQAEIRELGRLTAAHGRRPVLFYGGQTASENEAAYRAFTTGSADLFIANTGKGAHGLNLPMAPTMIYYTRTFDVESYAQSLERNARLTSAASTVLNVIVLEAAGTADKTITRSLGDDLHKAAQVTAIDVAAMLGLSR